MSTDKSAENLLDSIQQRSNDLATNAPAAKGGGDAAVSLNQSQADEMLDLLRDIRSLLRKIKKALV
jgi:hypothetical protein